MGRLSSTVHQIWAKNFRSKSLRLTARRASHAQVPSTLNKEYPFLAKHLNVSNSYNGFARVSGATTLDRARILGEERSIYSKSLGLTARRASHAQVLSILNEENSILGKHLRVSNS